MTEWDVAVVGAGSAGAIVATRLAQRGARVLLLEAGPDYPDQVPPLLASDLRIPVREYDWGFRSEGDREIELPRGRVAGGSSATNAAAAVRPQPADQDGWGVPEWAWDRCLRSLCRLEDDADFGDAPYHGSGGPIHVERTAPERAAPVTRALLDSLVSAGYRECADQNAPGATGAGPQPFNTRDGIRQSTLVTYLPLARALPGFAIRGGAVVDRVVIEEGRARGLLLATGERIDADMVIVAAGAYCTPAILMRSGIGPADALRMHGIPVVADLPVGEGLQDHPALGLPALARDPAWIAQNLTERVMARASFDGRPGEEDVHVFGPFTGEATRSPIPPDGFVVAGMVVKPRSRGWVRLRARDPEAPPRIHLNYFSDDRDLETMERLMLAVEDLLDRPPLAKVVSEVLWRPSSVGAEELRTALRAGALTDHHPSGTAPIGTVLDPHLRVHGIEGLRVCDASVMPDTPRANTNIPTMMIAERFVELLDEETAAPA